MILINKVWKTFLTKRTYNKQIKTKFKIHK